MLSPSVMYKLLIPLLRYVLIIQNKYLPTKFILVLKRIIISIGFQAYIAFVIYV